MSLRKLAQSLHKTEKRSRGTSGSSAASWSPSNSRSHTPLASSVSLPDSILDSNQQRLPSTQSQPLYNPSQTPLRTVAPFVYDAPSQAYESTSTLSSTDSKDSGSTTLRLKRSLTKILTTSSDSPSHQYHYQKGSQTRDEGKESKKGSNDSESGKRSRKGSQFSGSSFFSEQASSSGPSAGSTKKIVSWIGQKQTGVTKKVQEALRSGGPSSMQSPTSISMSRVSNEFHGEEEDDKSSVSSAPSFVQNAPEDDVSRIFFEPDSEPPLPMTNLQDPFHIPAAVYLPRSHTNLHALTLASLAFPPSPHPLLYNPNLPAFPRSSNPSSKIPRLPTFRAHVAKTRILDRLEAQDLTQAENDSITPFGLREDFDQQQPLPPPNEGEGEEGRKINDQPGRSVGLEAWACRPSFTQRACVWKYDPGAYLMNADGIRYEPVTPSRPLKTEVKLTPGIKALAGLVVHHLASPPLVPMELPSPSKLLSPPLPSATSSSFSVGSVSSETLITQSVVLRDGHEISPTPTPASASIPIPSVHSPVPVSSPRPLPRPPNPADPNALISHQQVQQKKAHLQNEVVVEEEEVVQTVPVRPLPPRPLPVPPQPSQTSSPSATVQQTLSPQITVEELESVEDTVLVATAKLDSLSSSQLLSPPGSMNGHAVQPHSSSTVTPAPLTPMDFIETESFRRLSIGSMSAVIPVPGTAGLSLEEMDGLDTANPLELDHRRRSTVSMKASVHKRLSKASRASRGSSPSLRNYPLPTLSRYTPTESSGTSNEKINLQTQLSISSASFDGPSEPPEPVCGDPLSPVAVVEPVASVIGNINTDRSHPLEPSTMSEVHIDSFLLPQLSGDAQRPESEVSGRPSPVLPPSDPHCQLASDHRSLSPSTDIPPPATQKPQTSPLPADGSGGKPSPAGSTSQSPTASNLPYSTEREPPRTSHLIATLPLEVALDVARLSDTSDLDLTLYNPQRSPQSTGNDLSRTSLSSARSRSDSDSASRAVSVKEIAANMPLLPSIPGIRTAPTKHARSPSSERAARIEAHLDSVGRYKNRDGSQKRPDFLPFPGYSRKGYSATSSQQAKEDNDRTPMQGSFNGMSPTRGSIDDKSFQQDQFISSRSNATFIPPVSKPPARWSEAGWRERQRSLNTLPLPSASISHSATRRIPYSSMDRATPVMLRPPKP